MSSDEEEEKKESPKPKPKPAAQRKSTVKKKAEPTELPEGIMADEVKDPDVQRNLFCYLYVMKM